MYSKAEKQKAVDLYIKYGKRAATAVSEPGYPDRQRLWCKEFKEEGYLREGCDEPCVRHKGQGGISISSSTGATSTLRFQG